MNRKGFTLIELLIVVAIIGILAAVGAAVIPGLLENTKEKAIMSQHKEIVKYVQAEFLKCSLGYEYIFSTTSGVTSKCSILSSGSDQGDPATDIGTALKNTFTNIYEPKDGAGNVKLAFAKASGGDTKCTARDSGGDAGCHFIGWDRVQKLIKIYTYYDGPNSPEIKFVNFD